MHIESYIRSINFAPPNRVVDLFRAAEGVDLNNIDFEITEGSSPSPTVGGRIFSLCVQSGQTGIISEKTLIFLRKSYEKPLTFGDSGAKMVEPH